MGTSNSSGGSSNGASPGRIRHGHGEDGPQQQRQWNTARLDTILRQRHISAIDVLGIHVLGRELSVLRSATALFQAGTVRAVAVAIFGPKGEVWPRQRQDAAAIGRFLREQGFELIYQGKRNREAEDLLADEQSLAEGTSTLVAEQKK